ncbi:MAG: phosphotransferase [Pseudomonadota bacterium]
MLSQGDAALVRRDRTIPGLATVLDSDAFLAALRLHMPGVDLQSIHPDYVRYKPLTRCLVAYRIKTADTELVLYANAYGPDATVRLKKAHELHHTNGPHGPGVLVMESRATAVYIFPTDRRLKALRHLTSASETRKLLQQLIPQQPALHDGTLSLLRYKPERRYVARLDTAQGPRAVVKFYNPAGYAAAKTGAMTFVSRGPLRLARTAGFSDRHHILAFEWQNGQLLRDILVDSEATATDKAAAMQLTGAALAGLHAHPAGSLGLRSRDGELRRMQAQAVTLEHLCPALARPARRLLRRITTRLQDTPASSLALHSDFYDRQVLITDDTAMLLDLDQVELGDPVADLGLFIAHLERDALQDRLSAETVGMLTDALLQGYQQVRQGSMSAAIRGYTAIGLLYLAAEPFRYREPDWVERTAAILSRADKILDSLGTPAHTTRGVGGSRTVYP